MYVQTSVGHTIFGGIATKCFDLIKITNFNYMAVCIFLIILICIGTLGEGI